MPAIDRVEVFGVVRPEQFGGLVDRTPAVPAVEGLEAWPGERFGHRLWLRQARKLRATVRRWESYVALAEAHQAVLVTLDPRLAAAGPTCQVEMITTP